MSLLSQDVHVFTVKIGCSGAVVPCHVQKKVSPGKTQLTWTLFLVQKSPLFQTNQDLFFSTPTDLGTSNMIKNGSFYVGEIWKVKKIMFWPQILTSQYLANQISAFWSRFGHWNSNVREEDQYDFIFSPYCPIIKLPNAKTEVNFHWTP